MNKIDILIVDDEIDLCNVLCDQFSFYKDMINCDKCYSAEEALKMMENQNYSLILTDIKMPGMNGIELIRTVKSKIDNDIKLYAMTGYSEYSESDIRAVGGEKLFNKPEDIQLIIDTIINFAKSKN